MRGKTRVVGIAGGSASGKSTLTRALAEFLKARTPALSVEILSADSFYFRDRESGVIFTSPSTGEERLNFNHPDAIDTARLCEVLQARVRADDAPDILFVEGLMVLQIPAIRELLDVRIFLELEADVRAIRRLLRDMKGGRGNADPAFIGSYDLECARVGHQEFVEPSRVHADLIVRGDAVFERTVPLVAAAITN